jgi:hypothetical protein
VRAIWWSFHQGIEQRNAAQSQNTQERVAANQCGVGVSASQKSIRLLATDSCGLLAAPPPPCSPLFVDFPKLFSP